jgi:Short C-terminal domain
VDVPLFGKPALSSASTLHDLLESKGLLGDDPDVCAFGGFRVIRGSGFDLPRGALCSVNCTPVDVRIVVVGGRQIVSIPYEELTDVEIAMASALNALLTTTVMRIASRTGEVSLQNGAMTPDAMRSAFSPLFTRMEAAKGQVSKAPVRNDDPAAELERLTRLRDSGALTEEEFQAARAPLVQRLLDSR